MNDDCDVSVPDGKIGITRIIFNDWVAGYYLEDSWHLKYICRVDNTAGLTTTRLHLQSSQPLQVYLARLGEYTGRSEDNKSTSHSC